jgi:hypothetical protein
VYATKRVGEINVTAFAPEDRLINVIAEELAFQQQAFANAISVGEEKRIAVSALKDIMDTIARYL